MIKTDPVSDQEIICSDDGGGRVHGLQLEAAMKLQIDSCMSAFQGQEKQLRISQDFVGAFCRSSEIAPNCGHPLLLRIKSMPNLMCEIRFVWNSTLEHSA
jgi:hypothetical protein